MLTCVLFGLAPALRATGIAPSQVMNASGRGLTWSRERFGFRRALVVSQIALSLVLVAGALLFVRSLRNLLTLDPGFSQSGILIVNVDFSKFNVPKDQREDYKRQTLERATAVPGVDSGALAEIVPVSGNGWNQSIMLDGEQKGLSVLNRVSPGYFRTIGTPLIAGRDFSQQDTATSPKVAIVNEAFAKKYLGVNAIGKTFKMDHGVGDPDPTYEVVGVTKNAKYSDMREDFQPGGFFPEAQDPRPDQFTQIMIRSDVPFETLRDSIKRNLAELNPAIAIDFHVFKTQIRDGLLRERLMATLSGFFGLLAGVLAIIGLYGVISYMVARRTSEIGVRMALGATPQNVLNMILGEAGVLLAIGLATGTIITAAATRTAKAMLYGLKPYDPATLAMAVIGLALVAVAASYIPAHRAARLQPMIALREE
jgi:predicted permease